jgi:uncharacterized lipoprotein YddW (UPF0748 family)
MQILPLFLLALLGGQQVLDDFRYDDNTAAQAAWKADEGTPSVDVVGGKQTVLRLNAPFATQPKTRRAVADRRVQLDLSAPGGFLLETAVDDPASIGGLTLYFRSGNGWYSADKPVTKKGWRTLRFSKTAFTVEGTPAGWDKIDGIRLSAWRPMGKNARDTSIQFRRLASVWHDVALIVPAAAKTRTDVELAAARDSSHKLATLLDELGLGADPIDEAAVSAAAIGTRRIVALPSNFTPSDACINALAKFVESGGKLVIYSAAVVPPRLRDSLKLPDDPNTAVQQNDRGAIFDYVVPADSREARNQLATTLGRLLPPLWKEIAEAEIDRADKVGHFESFADAASNGLNPRSPRVARYLNHAIQDWNRAHIELLKEKDADYAQVIELAQSAHDSLVQAYLLAADSPKPEARAVWNHSGTGAFPGDWDRSMKLLANNGFNMVFPNMLWAGLAHYPSDVLPRSVTFKQHGDQIEQCCAAAKKYGIEVHVWKVNFNLTNAPKEFVEKLRKERRTQVSVKGEPSDWLCPSNPKNQKLELDSLLEIVRKYPVAGLHLDYIRYPGRESCYCAGCRKRFEAATKRKVPDADWPQACFSGNRKNKYNDWRCRQITDLVAAISREAKRVRPTVKISAAVFGSYPGCRESVAQDWPEWIKRGYLDFVCPMNYSADDEEFASLVRNQIKLIDGRVPLYPGIGATATGIHLAPDRVVGQIIQARKLGATGFSIFNLSPQTAAQILPAIGQGVGSHRALPPHQTK